MELSILFFLFLSTSSSLLFNLTDEVYCNKSNAPYICGSASVCVNESGILICHCDTDDDCGRLMVCQNNTKCSHKPLWKPSGSDVATGILLVLFSAIAASSGTGGGGLLVALFIALENFTTAQAIPLSKASILGSAVANAFYNFFQRHPEVDKPLIDFDLIGYLEPPVLLGTVIGVYLVKLLPSWLVLVLLVILLGYTAYRTITKGMSLWKKESAQMEKSTQILIPDVSEANSPGRRFVLDSDPINEDNLLYNNSLISAELHQILEDEKRVPWLKLLSFLLVWAVVFIVAILKGGEGKKSPVGITCGTVGYWLLVCSLVPFVIIYIAIFGHVIERDYRLKVRLSYPFLESDIQWNRRLLFKLPFICVIAGIAAGLFGIGSGMIIGPILLTMNVHPRVSAAVSAFMILFTASSTTIQFAIFGMLQYDYALCFGILAFAGALIGQFGVSWILKKYNKTSIVVFILAFIIVAGAIALAVMGGIRLADDRKNGVGLWSISPVCS
eukprot:TRINITY_DN3952_c0_g1_i1.p1 TRINITY_DN3952_c0_g1~~TRINITY_DN3952_c0_g1_i1.p1  ORF type:complete len:500 (+),score=67.78 TRINITY_DN3952_c0_g1_i1:75-1574(+)